MPQLGITSGGEAQVGRPGDGAERRQLLLQARRGACCVCVSMSTGLPCIQPSAIAFLTRRLTPPACLQHVTTGEGHRVGADQDYAGREDLRQDPAPQGQAAHDRHDRPLEETEEGRNEGGDMESVGGCCGSTGGERNRRRVVSVLHVCVCVVESSLLCEK